MIGIRKTMVVMAILLMMNSCFKRDLSSEPAAGTVKQDTPSSRILTDVSYGSNVKQKADIYLPAGRNTSTRTIVFIHGGGWSSGDKSQLSGHVSEFQKRLPGYAIANLNYRLASIDSNHFPAQENDIRAAIRFLKSSAAEYGIGQDYIFLGMSAGAHLAALQGYKHADDVRPKGIIALSAPVDLVRIYQNPSVTLPLSVKLTIGGALAQNPDIFFQSSPINFIDATASPTLILHGALDSLVPVEQAYLLHEKLDSMGVRNSLVVYPKQGHSWMGDDLNDSFSKVEEFIKGL